MEVFYGFVDVCSSNNCPLFDDLSADLSSRVAVRGGTLASAHTSGRCDPSVR